MAVRGATIEIRLNEITHSGKSDTGSSNEKNKNKNSTSKDLQESRLAMSYITQQVGEEVNTLVSFGMQQFSLWLSLTDNIQVQRNITNAMNVISKSISVGSSLIVGAVSAGPIGLAMAMVVQGTQLGIDIFKNYQQQQIQIDTMQTQLNFSRERSGYSLTSGGR